MSICTTRSITRLDDIKRSCSERLATRDTTGSDRLRRREEHPDLSGIPGTRLPDHQTVPTGAGVEEVPRRRGSGRVEAQRPGPAAQDGRLRRGDQGQVRGRAFPFAGVLPVSQLSLLICSRLTNNQFHSYFTYIGSEVIGSNLPHLTPPHDLKL